jgi:hypothetical protein
MYNLIQMLIYMSKTIKDIIKNLILIMFIYSRVNGSKLNL